MSDATREDLEQRVRELEAENVALRREAEEADRRTISASQFWVAEAERIVERERDGLAAKDAVITRIKAELRDTLAARKDKDWPPAREVAIAYDALQRDVSEKEKQLELAERFCCSDRTIRRRLEEWDEGCAKMMGITLEQYRSIGR